MMYCQWRARATERAPNIRGLRQSQECPLFPARLGQRSGPNGYVSIMAPLWALVLAFSVIPAAKVFLALKIRRRRRAGLCRACGYDLRASPERCPECGTVSAQAEVAAA